MYPAMSPEKGDDDLKRVQALLPNIEPGDGRSPVMQATFQLTGLFATLVLALVTGAVAGNMLMKYRSREYQFHGTVNSEL